MASGTISGTITFRPSGIPLKVTTRRSPGSVAEAADMIAFAKPSWILMAAVALFVSAHWRSSAASAVTCQSGCHVRDFERSTVNRPAADKNSRGDVFAVPQRGGVGSDAFDNQVETLPARCFRVQIDAVSRDFGPLDSGAVVRESAVP